jgi:hypothetical protein
MWFYFLAKTIFIPHMHTVTETSILIAMNTAGQTRQQLPSILTAVKKTNQYSHLTSTQ